MTQPSEARDDIHGLITTAWGVLGPIDFWDQPRDQKTNPIPPITSVPWLRVKVVHNTGRQATLAGAIGTRRFRRTGNIFVQVFDPIGSSLRGPELHGKLVNDALEGVATAHDVLIRNVRMNELGSEDGQWFQTNVIADFEYDEVK